MTHNESDDNQEHVSGSFSVGVRLEGPGVVVLAVHGEVDLDSAPFLSESISAAIERGPEVIVVDLSQVKVFTSAGVAVILGGHNRAQGVSRFRVVSPGEVTTRPLELLGLTKVLAVFPIIDEALATP